MRKNVSFHSESIAIFLSSLTILSTIAYVSVTPRPKEQFFQIYVLGETRMAEKYYPGGNPNIPLGVRVKWYLGATNFMGSLQYVVLKVKLANSTMSPPDDVNKLPSLAPMLMEFRRVLMDNETWEFPLIWSIDEIRIEGDACLITSMIVNDRKIFPEQVPARRAHNYRIIIEIWTLDPMDQRMIFGWRAGNERKVAWLQVWFNVTMPKPSF